MGKRRPIGCPRCRGCCRYCSVGRFRDGSLATTDGYRHKRRAHADPHAGCRCVAARTCEPAEPLVYCAISTARATATSPPSASKWARKHRVRARERDVFFHIAIRLRFTAKLAVLHLKWNSVSEDIQKTKRAGGPPTARPSCRQRHHTAHTVTGQSWRIYIYATAACGRRNAAAPRYWRRVQRRQACVLR